MLNFHLLTRKECETLFGTNELANRLMETQSYFVFEKGQPIYVLGFFQRENTMEIEVECLVKDILTMDELWSGIQQMVAYCTFQRSSHKMLVTSNDDAFNKVLRQCLFYPKGNKYQRINEPWLQTLPKACFNQEMFLINQGKMKDIDFGGYRTDQKGCGWIAAYNLLKAAHQEKSMYEVVHELEHLGLSKKPLGENVFVLCWYLKKLGLPVEFTPVSQLMILHKIKTSKAGILLYLPKHAHYTMYRKEEDGYTFYNAVYGKVIHVRTPESFFMQYQKFPYQVLLSIA